MHAFSCRIDAAAMDAVASPLPSWAPAGVYTENVVIPVDKANLTLIGEVDSDGVQQSILQCSGQPAAWPRGGTPPPFSEGRAHLSGALCKQHRGSLETAPGLIRTLSSW